MKKTDIASLLKTNDGCIVPAEHLLFKKHFLVFRDMTEAAYDIAQREIVATGAEMPAAKAESSFLRGIKINGQKIARHDPVTLFLFDKDGNPLGVSWDINAEKRKPSGLIRETSLVSTDFEVTASNGAPLATGVFLVETGNNAQIVSQVQTTSPDSKPEPGRPKPKNRRAPKLKPN